MLVLIDCAFIGVQPILVQKSKNSQGTYSYQPVAVNFITEMVKMGISLAFIAGEMLFCGRRQNQRQPLFSDDHRGFFSMVYRNRLLALPATLYALNNYLKFAMQLYFRPTTTRMIGNLKILCITVIYWIFLKRKFSVLQWEALSLLVVAVTVNKIGCQNNADKLEDGFHAASVICTLAYISVPATASVFNEVVLKKQYDTSIHQQNLLMFFFGTNVNFLSILYSIYISGAAKWSNEFVGINSWTVFLILVNAGQGVLSSFFYKFADTILKKQSSNIATFITGFLSAIWLKHVLGFQFLMAMFLVCISMHQYYGFKSLNVGMENQPKMVVSPSMEHLRGQSATPTNMMQDFELDKILENNSQDSFERV